MLINIADPHSYFYLTYKVYKKRKLRKPRPTRSVCSDCPIITNPIDKWVDTMLQPVVKAMCTYLQDLFAFNKFLKNLRRLFSEAKLFTLNKLLMFANIDTNAALVVISKYLQDNKRYFGHCHANTLLCAMEIVRRNNIIKSGDKYVR